MSPEVAVALIAGGLGVGGSLAGVALSGHIARGADQRRQSAEDSRRWLADRRVIYARYVGLVEAMLREIDRVGNFLPGSPDESISASDQEFVTEALQDYFEKWDDELQPALGEVQLIAGPAVADVADRMSGALMEVTSPISVRGDAPAYYELWFRARDMLDAVRDAMRSELGLAQHGSTAFPARNDPDWPWLPDRAKLTSRLQHPASQKTWPRSIPRP